MISLIQLEYLTAIAKFGSFVKASEKCFVTQPTLSMQVQKLEEELGVQMFDRTKKPVQPTEIGQLVIDKANMILREAKSLNDMVDNLKSEISGELRIGIIPTISGYLVPLFINRFLEKYPKVKVKIVEQITEEIVYMLKNNDLDMGIVATPLDDDYIVETPIFQEPFMAYFSENHELLDKKAVQPEMVNIDDIWILSDGHCFRNHVINLCHTSPNFNENKGFSYESGSLDSIVKLVDSQQGYTLLPYLSTLYMSNEQQTRLRPFNLPVPTREISVVTNRSCYRFKIKEALINEIISDLPEDITGINNPVRITWK